MRFTLRRAGGPHRMSWTARTAAAALLISGSMVTLAGAAAAQARPASPGTSAAVVMEAFRTGFGKILVTHGAGMALYTNPNGCSKSCQTVWPPLLMPKGTTTPTGAPCLGTAKHGTRLQVTYHKMRLYTFTGDSGHSVNGDGVAGFHVAKLVTGCKA